MQTASVSSTPETARSMKSPKQTVKEQWSSAAAAWEKSFDWYTENFAPLMDWMCDAAGITEGSRVLDLGCGSGQPSLTAAQRAGKTGHVLATDISPEMVDAARRAATNAGLTNISFREMDAENLELPDATFDSVTFACCLMFCPDPVRAVSEVRRVLKPGGRFSIAVWDDVSRNPFVGVIGKSFGTVVPSPPPPPDAPAAFRFAPPGALESVLREGGFEDFKIESRPMMLDYGTFDGYWRMNTELAAGLKGKLDALPTETVERIRSLALESAAPFMSGGGFRILSTPLCASGTRSARERHSQP